MAQLCPLCTELFSQPNIEPSSRDSWEDPHFARFKRSGQDVKESAISGCSLCKIVWKECWRLLGARYDLEEAVIGPSIYWSNDRNAFCSLVYRVDAGGYVHPELLKVELYPEDAVGNTEPGVPRPSHTAQASLSMASAWLWECATNHESCRPQNRPLNWLPTRLVDVGAPWTSQDPRLVITSQLNRNSVAPPLYVSLSHRWTEGNVLRLTQHVLDDMLKCISPADLSPTFQDAIRFTRALGIRYIWIDSLCIIQDSPTDWLQESSSMSKIYEYAFCNIAATAASGGTNGGLYQARDPLPITPYSAHIHWGGHERNYLFFLGHQWYKSVDRAPLNRRGWVFQERLLSPRTLHFSSQLFWECRSLQACETYPSGLPDSPAVLGNDLDQTFPSSAKAWRREVERCGFDHWDLLTQMYCRCFLTRPSDRLVAIAGIAQKVQPFLNDAYVAGLWKSRLPFGLLWMLRNMVGQDLVVTKPPVYRGPSWTWTSLDFDAANLEIPDDGGLHRVFVDVLDVHIECSPGERFTNITGGYLLLLGKVALVTLPDMDDAQWRGDRGGHYTFEYSLDTLDHHAIQEGRVNDQAVYCLPVATHDRANGNSFESLQVHCLLLQRTGKEHETNAFTRIGVLLVLLDWLDEPEEGLRWIVDFARTEKPLEEDVDVCVIY